MCGVSRVRARASAHSRRSANGVRRAGLALGPGGQGLAQHLFPLLECAPDMAVRGPHGLGRVLDGAVRGAAR